MPGTPYLKSSKHVVQKRRRDEQRLGLLFGIVVSILLMLLIYYLPKTAPTRSQLFAEGKAFLTGEVRTLLLNQGLTEIKTSTASAAQVSLGFVLPAECNQQSFYSQLERYLRQRRFKTHFAAHLATDNGFTIFVNYQDIPIGSIAFYQKIKPEETIAPPVVEAYKPRIAIVIDDFGNSDNEVIRNFLQLNMPLTVSIIPGHAYSQWVADKAHQLGKEIIIHMPMEPEGKAYQSGEDQFILRTSMSPDEINRRLERAFQELPEARGMNNHMGSLFTADENMMKLIMQSLKRKGVYFIDSLTSPRSVAYEIARTNGVPAALRTVFLDNVRDKSEIKAQFESALTIARRSGKAIVIGHVHPETLAALQEIQQQGLLNNVELIYASQIVE